MAKDPAVLFYTSDFLIGTYFMSFDQKGQYIQLLCVQHQNGRIPKDYMMNTLGSLDNPVWEKFEADEEGFYFNKRMKEEAEKRKAYTESRRNSRKKADEDNVRIYLIRDNETGNIKIGSSVNPTRRLSEMINQKSPAILSGTSRDYELIFFSNPTLRIEETKLHKKYNHLRVNGEWFSLTEKDIKEIRMCFHTSQRNEVVTENENEDENINVLDLNNKSKASSKNFDQFLLRTWGGKDGRASPSLLKQFIELGDRHGWDKLCGAIETAETYNKKSFAYVKAILEPSQTKSGEEKRSETAMQAWMRKKEQETK